MSKTKDKSICSLTRPKLNLINDPFLLIVFCAMLWPRASFCRLSQLAFKEDRDKSCQREIKGEWMMTIVRIDKLYRANWLSRNWLSAKRRGASTCKSSGSSYRENWHEAINLILRGLSWKLILSHRRQLMCTQSDAWLPDSGYAPNYPRRQLHSFC